MIVHDVKRFTKCLLLLLIIVYFGVYYRLCMFFWSGVKRVIGMLHIPEHIVTLGSEDADKVCGLVLLVEQEVLSRFCH